MLRFFPNVNSIVTKPRSVPCVFKGEYFTPIDFLGRGINFFHQEREDPCDLSHSFIQFFPLSSFFSSSFPSFLLSSILSLSLLAFASPPLACFLSLLGFPAAASAAFSSLKAKKASRWKGYLPLPPPLTFCSQLQEFQSIWFNLWHEHSSLDLS